MKPVTPMRLKIEINTREHFTVLGFERIVFSVDNPWFRGGANVLTYAPEELLGTKLRALYQRRKWRCAGMLRGNSKGRRWSIWGRFIRITVAAQQWSG